MQEIMTSPRKAYNLIKSELQRGRIFRSYEEILLTKDNNFLCPSKELNPL